MKKQKFNKQDYSASNLPKDRKQQFFDIFKHKYRLLFLVGIAMFLFLIPTFICNISLDLFLYRVSSDPAMVNGEVISSTGMSVFSFSILIYAIIEIFTYLIAFIGLSGVMRIIRMIVWNKGVLFWNDFWIGLKQNIKQFLLISIIFSLGNLFLSISRITSGFLFTGIAYGLAFGIINPYVIITVCYASTYSISTRKALWNGFALFTKNYPKMLLLSLFTLLYFLLDFIPIPIVMYLVKIAAVVFIMPVFLLASYLVSTNIFDNTINAVSHPEQYKLGLYTGGDSGHD